VQDVVPQLKVFAPHVGPPPLDEVLAPLDPPDELPLDEVLPPLELLPPEEPPLDDVLPPEELGAHAPLSSTAPPAPHESCWPPTHADCPHCRSVVWPLNVAVQVHAP
jgi:hypothetical protein